MSPELKIGDEIFVGSVRGRGGHGAYIVITKVNAKSWKGVEREKSYSPGTNWTIHKESTFAVVTYDGSRVDEKGQLLSGLMRRKWYNDY